jgi:hypothetical protein
MCFWEGFAGVAQALSNAPRVKLPMRSYFLMRAPLKVIGTHDLLAGLPIRDVGPSIWWPDDRSWCVATEVDFRWTYVGGSSACIDGLLADPRLEALPAESSQRGDFLGERINRPVNPR